MMIFTESIFTHKKKTETLHGYFTFLFALDDVRLVVEGCYTISMQHCWKTRRVFPALSKLKAL